jgi:GTP pyrophosphokinase
VGYGRIPPERIVHIIAPDKLKAAIATDEPDTFLKKVFKSAVQKTSGNRSAIKIHGMNDILVRFGRCCSPIPGDPIVGFITRGRGITVHLSECPKAYDTDAERRVDVEWARDEDSERVAKIRIVCVDEPGLLQKMSLAFTDLGINIHQAQVRATKDHKAISQFEVNIKNITQLNKAMKALETIKGVISVERIKF